MTPSTWLVIHLVAVAVLTGVGWVVQAVVYPGFRLVGRGDWGRYHAHHLRAITPVVTVPWLVQGVSTVALLVAPAAGGRVAAVGLAALALVAVAATVTTALPAHGRLAVRDGRPAAVSDGRPAAVSDGRPAAVSDGRPAAVPDSAAVATLLRANLVRTLAWTGSTALAAALLR